MHRIIKLGTSLEDDEGVGDDDDQLLQYMDPAFLKRMEEEEAAQMERIMEINERILARIPVSSAEMSVWRQWQFAGAPSKLSSSFGGKEEEEEEEEEEKGAEDALLFLPPTWRGGPGQQVRVRGRVAGGHGGEGDQEGGNHPLGRNAGIELVR